MELFEKSAMSAKRVSLSHQTQVTNQDQIWKAEEDTQTH